MSRWSSISKGMLAAGLMTAAGWSMAYTSGSTGADGAFNPTASQSIQLPPDGVFNYTSVNIPAGVTITYKKNAANTPVYILVGGDATIAGIIDASATPPVAAGDISGPGVAGPGGYDGGRGGQSGGDASIWINGLAGPNIGRVGVGPGGGTPAPVVKPNNNNNNYFGGATTIGAGGGGAFGTVPPGPGYMCPVTPGVVYGNTSLLPLVGGSGGGGGAGGSMLPGSGGGGGGGAILIAASGTINVTGSILANGGVPVSSTATGRGSQGGGGSGGAIRLIATTISGNGAISAAGGSYAGEYAGQSAAGTYYAICSQYSNGSQNGGAGRIRIESETLTRTAATTPSYVGGSPNLAFVPGLPTLSIASVGGIAVPATPTGNGDVTLPQASGPVTVVFATRGVTVGSTIKLTVIPPLGTAITATSPATTGTMDNATASVSVTLPAGSNILQASLTYTVVASLGDAMSIYAQGERVEKVQLIATLGGSSMATLITVSGKEFTVPAAVLAGFQA